MKFVFFFVEITTEEFLKIKNPLHVAICCRNEEDVVLGAINRQRRMSAGDWVVIAREREANGPHRLGNSTPECIITAAIVCAPNVGQVSSHYTCEIFKPMAAIGSNRPIFL